jgi:hypothetical protein
MSKSSIFHKKGLKLCRVILAFGISLIFTKPGNAVEYREDKQCGTVDITHTANCPNTCLRQQIPNTTRCDAFSHYTANFTHRNCVDDPNADVPPRKYCCVDKIIVCWGRYHPAVPCTGGGACLTPGRTTRETSIIDNCSTNYMGPTIMEMGEWTYYPCS